MTDDGPPAKARITELEDRAPERAALAAPDLRQISETHGLLITPHHYPSAPAPMLQALSRLDDRLVEVLRSGDLRILRSAWLSQQPDTYRLQGRQELEKLDGQGASSALLSPGEAVALVQQCDRSVGALTHGAHPVCGRTRALLVHPLALCVAGWLSPGNPDPAGQRLQVVQQALAKHTHIQGLFWECAPILNQTRCSAVRG